VKFSANLSTFQVGDANKDHACWERPEDMDTPRTVVKIDSSNPGSDVAAETAAALAAASLVFRRSDPSYSRLLLSRATSVQNFPNSKIPKQRPSPKSLLLTQN